MNAKVHELLNQQINKEFYLHISILTSQIT